MQEWLVANSEYLTFLRENVDNRIPKSEYGKQHFKPFFGKLFETDGLMYVTQISSAKKRHLNMKNSYDFKKVFIENKLVAVVNLNYMFPVPNGLFPVLNLSDISKYREFQGKDEENKYVALMNLELNAVNNMSIENAAVKLYKLKNEYPDHMVSMRCLDFSKLENVAKTF